MSVQVTRFQLKLLKHALIRDKLKPSVKPSWYTKIFFMFLSFLFNRATFI